VRSIVDAVRDVLGSPALRRAEGAWLLGIAAEWIYVVNLLVVAHELGGVLAVGLIGTLRMLPAAILAPIVGSVTDRLPRPRVLRGVHVVRGMSAGAAAALLLTGVPAWPLFGLAVIDGVAATLHRPTTIALLPELARSPAQLINANAATSTAEGLGVLLGPALGGLLLAVAGPTAGMVGAATGFALAAATIWGVPATTRAALVTTGSGLAELAAGARALGAYPSAGRLIAIFAAQTLIRGALTVLLVASSVELLGLGQSGVGYLTAALGAGNLVGAVAAFSLVRGSRLAPTFTLSLAAWGLPIVAIGLLPLTAVAFPALAIIGVANAVLDVTGFTLLVRCVPNELRGRVLGLLEGMVSLTVALGSLVAPAIVALLGLTTTLVAVGAVLPAVALLSIRVVRAAQAASLVPDAQLALLARIPMFAPLPLATTERLAGAMEPFAVGRG
jgi:MFS family permease